MAKNFSFNQKLLIVLATMSVLFVFAVVLVVVLSKNSSSGRAVSQFVQQVVEEAGAPSASDESGEPDEQLLKDAEEMIKKDPNDGEGYAQRAQYYYWKDDYDKALNDFNKAISIQPKNADWYHWRGWVWKYKNDNSKAVDEFTKAIELDNTQKEYFFDRGEIYASDNEGGKALSDFKSALEAGYPDAIVHNRRGQVFKEREFFDEAVEEFKQSVDSPDEPVEGYRDTTTDAKTSSLNALSQIYVYRADFRKALECLDAWVKLDPSDDAYSARALYFRAFGEKEKERSDRNAAVKYLTNRIDDEPQAHLFRDRGDAYKELGQTKEADADYRKALELYKKDYADPDQADDKEDNLEMIEEIQELIDEKVAAKNREAEFQKEIADINAKIAKEPKESGYYTSRAWIYLHNNQLDLAMKDFELALKLEPDDSWSEVGMASVFTKQKKYDRAIALYKSVLDGYYSESTLPQMANVLEQAGKHDEAIKYANKAIAEYPDCPQSYFIRSKAFESKGDKEKAKNSFAQAILLGYEPGDEKDY